MTEKEMAGHPIIEETAETDEPEREAAYDLDAEKYLAELADFDMTEEQQIEMLQMLWSIMRTFVELGFDLKNCELFRQDSDKPSDDGSDDVNYPNSTTTETPSSDDRKEGSA